MPLSSVLTTMACFSILHLQGSASHNPQQAGDACNECRRDSNEQRALSPDRGGRGGLGGWMVDRKQGVDRCWVINGIGQSRHHARLRVWDGVVGAFYQWAIPIQQRGRCKGRKAGTGCTRRRHTSTNTTTPPLRFPFPHIISHSFRLPSSSVN